MQTIKTIKSYCCRLAGAIALGSLAAYVPASLAADSVGLGITLNGSTWKGDNGPGRSDFESDDGGQFAINLNFRRERFYTGINLQGGDYRFDSTLPDQFTSAGTMSSADADVEHSDFDLLVGYYFWSNLSLFLDLKVASSKWRSNGYRQIFSGLGLGISGFHTINDQWLLFGSLGFVSGQLDDNDDHRIGDGDSSALVAGAVYRVDDDDTINFGLKLRAYDFNFDDGNEQDFTLNGVFFGYNHLFDW